MTKFEIGRKSECLCHSDVCICLLSVSVSLSKSHIRPYDYYLEEHHRNRAPWNSITSDEFRNDIDRYLLVCYGLYYANWDSITKG